MLVPDQLIDVESISITADLEGDQRLPSVAVLADGRLVAVWATLSDTTDRYDIYARFLDADGTPIGEPFLVNTTTASDQIKPQVVALPGGGFSVVWESYGQDHFVPPDYNWYDIYQYGVYQQVFDATGTPVGSETPVNTSVVQYDQTIRDVTPLPDGGYVVTFFHQNFYSWVDRGTGTYLQRFDASGAPVGDNVELVLAEGPRPDPLRGTGITDIGTLGDGRLVYAGAGEGYDMTVAIQNPDGTLATRIAVGGGSGDIPAFAILPDDTIFTVWHDTDGLSDNVHAAVYDASGAVVMAPRLISQFQAGGQHAPDVHLLPDGNLLITWVDTRQHEDGYRAVSVFGRVVEADGTPVTGDTRLSDEAIDITAYDVEITPEGEIVVIFSHRGDPNGPGEDFNTYVRVFTVDDMPRVTVLPDGPNDVALGGEDNSVEAGNGHDTVDGGGGDDDIFGQNGNDLLMGGAGDDVLSGGPGNDTIHGGPGVDSIFAGAGDDVIHVDTDDVYEYMWSHLASFNQNYVGGPGYDTMIVHGSEGVSFENLSAMLIEAFFGSEGDDSVDFWGDNANLMRGRGGNDTLSGDWGNDTIFGDAGADSLLGGEGDDHIKGGAANDTIDGGPGNDFIHGQNGVDLVDGAGGNDTITGNNGEDTLMGGAGSDLVKGGYNWDTVYGGQHNDTVMGQNGYDTVYGGYGDDLVRGNNGNDRLYGEGNDDRLEGGPGRDTLEGGSGNDTLEGGTERDVFLFDTTEGTNDDVIEDFDNGVDTIHFSGPVSFDDLTIDQTGPDTIITWGYSSVTLLGETGPIDEDDFLFT